MENNIKDFENKIICDDCIKAMKKMPSNSVDSVVTDPPYHLTSIVKRFGKKDSAPAKFGTDGAFSRASKGFMGKTWDGGDIAFRTEVWKECLRVLKPGGHLLSFGGTRTYHRMTCAIEDAGFEIRDCLFWCYGSGFPKSLDIGKAMDKKMGVKREIVGIDENSAPDLRDVGKKSKEVIGIDKLSFGQVSNAERKVIEITKGNSEWEGWGTALKPAVEPIVLARKPLSEKTVSSNVLKWGTGGINIDGGRVEANWKDERPESWFNSGKSKSGNPTYGGNLKSITKSTVGERLNKKGRFPSNLILECNCERVEEKEIKGTKRSFKATDYKEKETATKFTRGDFHGRGNEKVKIHTNPDCPCYILDEQSGISKSCDTKRNRNTIGSFGMPNDNTPEYNDKGGTSRFFKIIYQPKAGKAEKNLGCERLEEKTMTDYGSIKKSEGRTGINTPQANSHPTVKPLALCEYLVRLITPPKGIVLDCFAGSGSTLIAAKKLGFRFIGIEKEAEYCRIAQARLNAQSKPLL